MVVTVPEVPRRWNRSHRVSSATRATKGASASDTWVVMAVKASSLTSTPPNVSASETTPSLSDSQAFTRFVAWRARIEAEPYDFRRSAPDVEHHGRLGVFIGEVADPRGGEMRLGLAVDNFELYAESFANHSDEVGPVGGRAAGFGGDRAGAGDPTRNHLVAAFLQGLERACNRRLA